MLRRALGTVVAAGVLSFGVNLGIASAAPLPRGVSAEETLIQRVQHHHHHRRHVRHHHHRRHFHHHHHHHHHHRRHHHH